MATPAPKDARHDLAGASTLGNLFPIHVLIATYDRDTLLERTLRTLAAAERPDGFESIYVVENGPPGGAEGICRRMAAELPIRFHHIEQSGKSRANQWAIEQIRTGFVIFFDDDVRVDPRTLVAYAAAASEGGDSCFYGGPFSVDYEEPPPQWLVPALPRSAVGWNPAGATQDTCVLGFNYAVFAERILEAGGFNYDLGPGASGAGTEGSPTGQETEMQIRLIRNGLRPVYVADARVIHHVGKDQCSPEWALRRHYRNRVSDAMLYGVTRRPLKLYLKHTRNLLRAGLSLFRHDEAKRFRSLRALYETRGDIAGLRRRSRSARLC